MKLLPIVLLLLLGAFLYLHAHFEPHRHSQRVSGRDVLSVAFGDAKTLISRAMSAKADLYFHGGIGHKCGECADAHICSEPKPHAPSYGSEQNMHVRAFDPWHWINEQVAAPDVHRHLEGNASVEMMPWLWASVRADPHNEEAWDAAWYTAAHMMKDDAVAAQILDEGLKANPNSARLYLTKGQFLYKMGKVDGGRLKGEGEGKRWAEARACFEKSVALAPKDSQIGEFAARYLADMDKKKVEVGGRGRENE